jgi:hypothetical protein
LFSLFASTLFGEPLFLLCCTFRSLKCSQVEPGFEREEELPSAIYTEDEWEEAECLFALANEIVLQAQPEPEASAALSTGGGAVGGEAAALRVKEDLLGTRLLVACTTMLNAQDERERECVGEFLEAMAEEGILLHPHSDRGRGAGSSSPSSDTSSGGSPEAVTAAACPSCACVFDVVLAGLWSFAYEQRGGPTFGGLKRNHEHGGFHRSTTQQVQARAVYRLLKVLCELLGPPYHGMTAASLEGGAGAGAEAEAAAAEAEAAANAAAAEAGLPAKPKLTRAQLAQVRDVLARLHVPASMSIYIVQLKRAVRLFGRMARAYAAADAEAGRAAGLSEEELPPPAPAMAPLIGQVLKNWPRGNTAKQQQLFEELDGYFSDRMLLPPSEMQAVLPALARRLVLCLGPLSHFETALGALQLLAPGAGEMDSVQGEQAYLLSQFTAGVAAGNGEPLERVVHGVGVVATQHWSTETRELATGCWVFLRRLLAQAKAKAAGGGGAGADGEGDAPSGEGGMCGPDGEEAGGGGEGGEEHQGFDGDGGADSDEDSDGDGVWVQVSEAHATHACVRVCLCAQARICAQARAFACARTLSPPHASTLTATLTSTLTSTLALCVAVRVATCPANGAANGAQRTTPKGVTFFVNTSTGEVRGLEEDAEGDEDEDEEEDEGQL